MKKRIKKTLEAIKEFFISMEILIDDSKRINENGSWDSYHAKRNTKGGVHK